MSLDKYLLLLAGFALLILTKVMVFTSTSVEDEESTRASFPIVVIDAGSSGSRAHIFHPTSRGGIEPKHESFKSLPGLSSYADSTDQAGPALAPLMDFIRQQIPDESIRQETKLVLKATAGMRLLPQDKQEAILNSVTSYLKQQEFRFVTAEVIDGEEEGLLGWTSVNYLQQSKGSNDLWSVMEMGGASVQVTYPLPASSKLRASALQIPKEFQRAFSLSKSTKGMVYTHSFLGLGMESARSKVNEILKTTGVDHDPCLNTGYDGEGFTNPSQGVEGAKPSSNGDECSELIRKVLFTPQTDDERKPCSHPQGCLFNGLPSFPSSTKLWGFENIFYTPSAMGMPKDLTFAQLLEEGKRVCSMDWPTLESQFPKDDQPKDINEKWCFGSMYLYTFFVDGLGLDPSMKMTVSNDVDGNGIDWSLGAALMQAHHH